MAPDDLDVISASEQSQVSADELDVAVLVGLAAPAVQAHVLARLHASGHPTVRAVHGFVFQCLIRSPSSIGALARDLRVTQQRVSTLVAELEEGGYVRRESRPGDARVRDVVLTTKGNDVIDIARRAWADLEAELEARVGDLTSARTALAALLELTDAADDVRQRRVPISET